MKSLNESAFETPAMVIKSEDHDVRSLAMQLERILDLASFSNNLRTR